MNIDSKDSLPNDRRIKNAILGDDHITVRNFKRTFEEHIQINKSSEVYYKLGVLYLYTGEINEGIKCLNESIVVDNYAPANNIRSKILKMCELDTHGDEYLQKGNIPLAIKAFESAKRIDSNNKHFCRQMSVKLSSISLKVGEYEKAIKETTNCLLKYGEKDPKLLRVRARSYYKLRKYDAAAKDLRMLDQLIPNDEKIRGRLRECEKKSVRDPNNRNDGQGKTKNFYELFGVGRNASEKDIIRSYKKMAMIYHPDKQKNQYDKFTGEKMMSLLTEGKEVLINRAKREDFKLNGSDKFGWDKHKYNFHDKNNQNQRNSGQSMWSQQNNFNNQQNNFGNKQQQNNWNQNWNQNWNNKNNNSNSNSNRVNSGFDNSSGGWNNSSNLNQSGNKSSGYWGNVSDDQHQTFWNGKPQQQQPQPQQQNPWGNNFQQSQPQQPQQQQQNPWMKNSMNDKMEEKNNFWKVYKNSVKKDNNDDSFQNSQQQTVDNGNPWNNNFSNNNDPNVQTEASSSNWGTDNDDSMKDEKSNVQSNPPEWATDSSFENLDQNSQKKQPESWSIDPKDSQNQKKNESKSWFSKNEKGNENKQKSQNESWSIDPKNSQNQKKNESKDWFKPKNENNNQKEKSNNKQSSASWIPTDSKEEKKQNNKKGVAWSFDMNDNKSKEKKQPPLISTGGKKETTSKQTQQQNVDDTSKVDDSNNIADDTTEANSDIENDEGYYVNSEEVAWRALFENEEEPKDLGIKFDLLENPPKLREMLKAFPKRAYDHAKLDDSEIVW